MKGISRINRIRTMTTEEMAKAITYETDIDDFCKSDCQDESCFMFLHEIKCSHPIECCIRWLQEESEE